MDMERAGYVVLTFTLVLLGIMGVIVCRSMVSATFGNEVVGAVATQQVAEVSDGANSNVILGNIVEMRKWVDNENNNRYEIKVKSVGSEVIERTFEVTGTEYEKYSINDNIKFTDGEIVE